MLSDSCFNWSDIKTKKYFTHASDKEKKKSNVHFQDIRMFLQMFLAIFSAFHVTLTIHLLSFLLCRKDGSVHVAHFGAPVVPTSGALNDTCAGAGAYTRTCSTSVPSGATDLTVHQDHNVSCCRYVVIQIQWKEPCEASI